ncbi:MAG: OprO/OprP family phosphate-selective porin [Holosporales bacterium]
MKKVLLGSALIASLTLAAPAFAATNAETVMARIQKLEEEIALLKRQQEIDQEKAKSVAEKAATVEYGPGGLAISSPDKRYSLRMRAYAQIDNRSFLDNSNAGNVDQFLVRTARPIIEATFDNDFSARLMFDFANNQSRLLDSYLDYKPDTAFGVRLGKFKVPLGIERWQSEQEIEFVERGLTTNLMPFRDLGVMVFGDILPQQLEYHLAYTNGTADLGDPSGDNDNGKEITARLFAHPFRNADTIWLQGLGVGVAASTGNRNGTTSSTNLTDGYRTPAQARFFTWTPGGTTPYAAGDQRRVNPQAYYFYGSLGAMAEYVVSEQDIKKDTVQQSIRSNGYMTTLTYILTGEKASFDGVKPDADFAPRRNQWGAFEVAGRLSGLWIEDAAFPTFSNPATSARAAREKTIGLNWYLNRNLKLNANYSHTTFDGGAAANQDRETEKVFLTRVQVRF